MTSETFIGHYKINRAVCDDVRKYFDKNKFKQKKGIVGGAKSMRPDYKDSYDIALDTEDIFHESLREYWDELSICCSKYIKQYTYSDRHQQKWSMGGCNIQKYKPKGGFKEWHYENSGDESSLRRHLVFMTFLNDCKKAGTMFYYQNKTYKCTKGHTLIWPAIWTHTHKGEISDKETKYIITGWYYYG